MAKLFSFLVAVGLVTTWLSRPVHAESLIDMNRWGTSYAAQSSAGTPSGPVVKPAIQTKSGVTDDSVIKRATKKPTR